MAAAEDTSDDDLFGRAIQRLGTGAKEAFDGDDDADGEATSDDDLEAGPESGPLPPGEDAGVGDADHTTPEGFMTGLGALLRMKRTVHRTGASVVPLTKAESYTKAVQAGGATPAAAATAAALVKTAAAALAGAQDGSARLKGAYGTVQVPRRSALPDDKEIIKTFSGRPAQTAAVSALVGTVTVEHTEGQPIGLHRCGLPQPGSVNLLIATSVGPGVAGRRHFFTILVTPDPPAAVSDVAIVVVANSGVFTALIAVMTALKELRWPPDKLAVDLPEELLASALASFSTEVGYKPDVIGPRADSTVLTIGGVGYRPIGEVLQDLAGIRTSYAIVGGMLRGAIAASQIFVGLIRRPKEAETAYYGILLEASGNTSRSFPGPIRARHQAKISTVLRLAGTIESSDLADALVGLAGITGVKRATSVALAHDVVSVPADQSVRFITAEAALALGDDEFSPLVTVPQILAAMDAVAPWVSSKAWDFADTVVKNRGGRFKQFQPRVLSSRPALLHVSSLEKPKAGVIGNITFRALLLMELAIKAGSSFRVPGQAEAYTLVPIANFQRALGSMLNKTSKVVRWTDQSEKSEERILDRLHRLVRAAVALAGYEVVEEKGATSETYVLVTHKTGPVGEAPFMTYTATATVSTKSSASTAAPPVRVNAVNLICNGDALMITLTSTAVDPITLAETLATGVAARASSRITTLALTALINLLEKRDDRDAWADSIGDFKASIAATAQMQEVSRTDVARIERLRALVAKTV